MPRSPHGLRPILPAARGRRVRLLATCPLLFVIACGGGGDPSSPPSPPPPPPPAAVATVLITPSTASLTPTQTVQLSATTQDASGTVLVGRTVSWSSSASAVAIVSANGLVTGVAPGSATISATSEGRSAVAEISVTPAPVATVTLSADSLRLMSGSTATLTAILRSATGDTLRNRTVTWSSSGVAVATVTGGVVSALSPGNTVITATSEGVSAAAVVSVVPVPVASVAIGGAPDSITVGQTIALTASTRDSVGGVLAGRTVTWTSSATAIISVNSSTGVATAIAPGVAIITASSEGRSASATMVVRQTFETFAALSVGLLHACALTTRGAAYCWGNREYGRLGNGGLTSSAAQATPVAVAGGLTFAKIAAGNHHTCAITPSGKAYCWGRNQYGESGTNTAAETNSTPQPVSGDLVFVSISAGNGITCGVVTSGAGYCWGSGAFGMIGNGMGADQATPTLVAGGHVFASISAGNGVVCGVTMAGNGLCWGLGQEGQRGDNLATATQATPAAVSGGLVFREIAAASTLGLTTCGVTTDDVAWCWGRNNSGQIGMGVLGGRLTPQRVAGEHAFVSVHPAWEHTCGVTRTGAAWCWGFGRDGQLGNGETDNRSSPVAVSGAHTFSHVEGGRGFVCGLRTDGQIYCWGERANGSLGSNVSSSQLVPIPITPVPATSAPSNSGPRYPRPGGADTITSHNR